MAKFLRDIAEILIITMVLFLLMRVAFPSNFVVGVSMEPTLSPGDRLLRVPKIVDQVQFWRDAGLSIYQQGDIIIFEPPPKYFATANQKTSEEDFVKRVIGTPGDVVDIVNGAVFVNGIRYSVITQSTNTNNLSNMTYPITVPPDSYFVLGDNRRNSSDSRHWGVVPVDNIVGQIWLIYWPLSEFRLLQ